MAYLSPTLAGEIIKGSSRGAKPLSLITSPSPLKERGTQGVRMIKTLRKVDNLC